MEKVVIDTKPVASVDEALKRDDALSGLLRAIRDMEWDDSALEGLAKEMSPLRQKLPPELLRDYDPAKPERLKEALEDIKEILVNRLLTTGEGE